MKWPLNVRKYKLHHIFLWMLFFAGWFYLRADDFSSRTLALQITFIKVFFIASLVYLTTEWLIPKYLYQKKYAVFFISYFLIIFGAAILKLQIIISMIYPGLNPFMNFKYRIYDNIIPVFLLVSTGAAFRLIADYLESQKKMAIIAREKAETELKYLKSQINPHFLFNSLNSIYFLIDRENSEARDALLQFSDLLRYQLYECGNDTIEVEKEMNYLNDYIRLQKLRKDCNYQIRVFQETEMKGFQIVPLLLLPLVENAFKHISHHSNGGNYVEIRYSRSNGHFNFHVQNTRELLGSVEPAGGIGLNNVKRRLDLLYPGNHEIRVIETDHLFTVDLQLVVK